MLLERPNSWGGGNSCLGSCGPLAGTLTASLLLAAEFSGAVKVISLEYKYKSSPVAITAAHRELQADQSE